MKLYCQPHDPISAKFAAVLNIFNKPYEIIMVDPKNPQDKAMLKEISPLGILPFILTEDKNILIEPILDEYRSKGFAGITPQDSRDIDDWIETVATEIEGLVQIIIESEMEGTELEKETKKSLETQLRYLDNSLQGKLYLVGHTASLADLCVAVSLLCPFKSFYDKIYSEKFPKLTKWLEVMRLRFRLSKLPSCLKKLS